jgi:hypothetical protein
MEAALSGIPIVPGSNAVTFRFDGDAPDRLVDFKFARTGAAGERVF